MGDLRGYVITLFENPRSWDAAQRCIASAREHGFDVFPMAACEPRDDPESIFARRGWDARRFKGNPYSRLEPCLATFLSHANLWARCAEENTPLVVLEHDAVFRAPLPDLSGVKGLCNLGKPSFGTFKTPKDGFGGLVSKPYLPGAHAYYLSPWGARELLRLAPTEAEPTDVFLHRDRFPFIEEFHPWPVECVDSFSTIQQELGCKAKHNPVEIIDP